MIAFFIALPVISKLKWELARLGEDDTAVHALLSLVLTLFAPISYQSFQPSHRYLMKRTITVITSSLLVVLTMLRTLPLLVDPDTLVATQGLCHLNFHQASGENRTT